MPVKRRQPKGHRVHVSPAALARWRAVGPEGIGDTCIDDATLAEALGMDPYLAMRPEDLAELREALDRAD